MMPKPRKIVKINLQTMTRKMPSQLKKKPTPKIKITINQ